MPNISMSDPEYWQGDRRALPGFRSKDWYLGPQTPDATRVMVLDMEPGTVIPRHAHNAERFEVIVKGSIWVGERLFTPGDVMTAHAGEFYGPKVAGPDGCTTMEVFADPDIDDSPLLFELADGSIVSFDPEVIGNVDNLAEAEWIRERRTEVLGAPVTS